MIRIEYTNKITREGFTYRMKKILMLFMSMALVFSAGTFVNVDHADAKGKKSYNSGTKGYQPSSKQNSNISNQNSNVNSPAKNTAPVKSTAAPAKSKSGGFMKGLLFGGIAGLLLGGLINSLGSFGAILGLLINVLFIVMAIVVIRKLYVSYKKKKKEQEANVWRN